MSIRRPTPAKQRRATILEAAKQAFARYGLRRTSMADIAELAGISRPALYEHFKDKDDVFRSLAESLSAAALAAAEAAWPQRTGFAAGLEAAVLAKDLEFFRLIHMSPHGAEILEGQRAVTDGLHQKMEARFAKLIAARLGGGRSALGLGLALTRAFDGLKRNAANEAEYLRTVKALAEAAGRAHPAR